MLTHGAQTVLHTLSEHPTNLKADPRSEGESKRKRKRKSGEYHERDESASNKKAKVDCRSMEGEAGQSSYFKLALNQPSFNFTHIPKPHLRRRLNVEWPWGVLLHHHRRGTPVRPRSESLTTISNESHPKSPKGNAVPKACVGVEDNDDEEPGIECLMSVLLLSQNTYLPKWFNVPKPISSARPASQPMDPPSPGCTTRLPSYALLQVYFNFSVETAALGIGRVSIFRVERGLWGFGRGGEAVWVWE